MAIQPAPAQLGRLAGFVAGAGLLVAASLQAVASTGIHPDCPTLGSLPEPVEFEAPLLRFEKTELGNGKPLPITSRDTSDSETAPTLTTADVIDELLGKDDSADSTEPPGSQTGLPTSATRLPGVDDDELPRFRRQMYRTDI